MDVCFVCTFCGRKKVYTAQDNYYSSGKYITQCAYCGERTEAFSSPEESFKAYLEGRLYMSDSFQQLRHPLNLKAVPDSFVLNLLSASYELWADDMRLARRTGRKKVCEELLDELDGGIISAIVDTRQLLKNIVA